MVDNEGAGHMIEGDPFLGATPISLDDRLLELEATLIGWALQVTHGNKSKAAELLRVKRSTLGDRINRCGLGRAGEKTPATASPTA
jgi:DNA-binding NtrC family response regulator